MARGGYRPGAGRPRGAKNKKPGEPKAPKKQPKKPERPSDTQKEASEPNMMPLDYMLKIMRDPNTDEATRNRMAIAAAPFVHPRAGEAKGKKEEKADRAKAASSGKFAAGRAPLSVVK